MRIVSTQACEMRIVNTQACEMRIVNTQAFKVCAALLPDER